MKRDEPMGGCKKGKEGGGMGRRKPFFRGGKKRVVVS